MWCVRDMIESSVVQFGLGLGREHGMAGLGWGILRRIYLDWAGLD